MSEKDAFAQLLSLAVHEFRTPASVVSGYLRMLQRNVDPPLSEQQRRMVEQAEKSCAHIVELVSELSEISKLDARTVGFAQQSFDLFQLVEEVAGCMHEAEDRGVRLATHGERAGAPVVGDLTRIRDAFAAIFRAILREQPSACTVVVDRRLVGTAAWRSAVIVVAEERIVQSAYEAAPGAFDEQRGGLGLALPIACRVIRAHGGRAWGPEGASRGAALVSLPLSELGR